MRLPGSDLSIFTCSLQYQEPWTPACEHLLQARRTKDKAHEECTLSRFPRISLWISATWISFYQLTIYLVPGKANFLFVHFKGKRIKGRPVLPAKHTRARRRGINQGLFPYLEIPIMFFRLEGCERLEGEA